MPGPIIRTPSAEEQFYLLLPLLAMVPLLIMAATSRNHLFVVLNPTLMSVAVASASWRWLEQPILRWVPGRASGPVERSPTAQAT